MRLHTINSWICKNSIYPVIILKISYLLQKKKKVPISSHHVGDSFLLPYGCIFLTSPHVYESDFCSLPFFLKYL